MPVDRLAVALDRPLTPAAAAGPLRAQLEGNHYDSIYREQGSDYGGS